jgi:xanthine dehydrogenase accessory factor
VAEIVAMVSGLLRMNEDLVLARVVSQKGSTPREAGARMIILKSGRSEGTVGGGLVEAAAMKEATRLFKERQSALIAMNMTADDAAGTDMICGGKMEVLCEYVEACEEAIRTFDKINTDHQNYRKNILCTELQNNGAGMKTVNRFLLYQHGVHKEKPVSPGLLVALTDTAGSLSGSALVIMEGRRFCLDVIDSMESLYLFGAGHVAKQVAGLASHVGFRVIVLDDREEFANAQRFPGPAEVRVLESFAGSIAGLMLDDDSYAVIVTRGHVHDKAVLEQALRTRAGYIGMIGSVRKRDTIYKALLSEGFTSDDLERVHCPIGVPIDTETPEEIAVSIVGELIHTRAQKKRGTQ